MKLGLALAMLAGLALATGLVIYQGAGEVLGALAFIKWGFAPIIALHVVQMLCSALGWHPLIGAKWRRPLLELLKIRWIREGMNGLLPVAHIGGEIVGARMLSFAGVRGNVAGASVVVDVTAEVSTQLLFTIIGLCLLAVSGVDNDFLVKLIAAIVVAVVGVGGFVFAQRFGLFKLIEHIFDRLMRKMDWRALGSVKGLHRAIRSIHRRPRALAASAAWHLVSWLLGAVEVWLALHFMNAGVGLREALILESLGQAVRSAGFAVPGAIGIQEGGLLLFGTMLGLAPDTALALSLAKRVREILLGLPALAFWQFVEGQRVLKGRRSRDTDAEES